MRKGANQEAPENVGLTLKHLVLVIASIVNYVFRSAQPVSISATACNTNALPALPALMLVTASWKNELPERTYPLYDRKYDGG